MKKPVLTRFAGQARHWAILVLGAFLGIFVLQNTAKVNLNFLFWSFESRRIVVIAISLVVGLVIGWLYGYSSGRKATGMDSQTD